MRVHAAHSHHPEGSRYTAPSLSPHDYLVLTLRGTPVYGRPPIRLPLEPGTLLHLPMGAPDADWVNPGPGEWEALWTQFSMRAEWRIWWSYPAHASQGSLVHLTPRLARRLENRFRELLRLGNRPAPFRVEAQMNLIERILLDCVTELPPPRKLEDERMARALRFLEENLDREIGIPELCEEVGLSRARLTHLFKETYRRPPMMLLEKLRLDAAANLLVATRHPISEIAPRCGFRDPLYFSRRFRRHSGLSPSEYREKNQFSLVGTRTAPV